MRLVIAFLRSQRGTMVADIAKAGAAIAFLSVIAANFVSSQTAQLDRDTMRQVAQAAARARRSTLWSPARSPSAPARRSSTPARSSAEFQASQSSSARVTRSGASSVERCPQPGSSR